jgi:glycolate oxidase FAD binding subunit
MSLIESEHTGGLASQRFLLDGQAPDRVETPATEDEAAAAVSRAVGEGTALVPWGGGTAIHQGNPLRAARWAALSSGRLNRVIEYSPDDMVVTAGAGLTLEALQAVLAEHNQFLPVDAPQADQATLGGIVAANAHGLLRPLFGTPRDRLLGARIALSDGTVVRGGGKVVKNVAGYDLGKLFCGSWGTLGFMTELTFKTQPRPEARVHRMFSAATPADAARAALAVHEARLDPAWMAVLDAGEPLLSVGLLGSAASVEWQGEAVRAAVMEAGLELAGVDLGEENVRGFGAAPAGTVGFRVTARPTELPELLEALGPLAARLSANVPVGVVEGILAPALMEEGPRMVPVVERALPKDAHLTWTRVPAEWKYHMDVWGPARPDHSLMRGVKQAFDPRGAFSPGRFLGGL